MSIQNDKGTSIPLSAGSIQRFQTADPNSDEDIFDREYTFQLLSIKKLYKGKNVPETCRAVISDGEHYMMVFLAEEAKKMVDEDVVVRRCVVVVDHLARVYVTNIGQR